MSNWSPEARKVICQVKLVQVVHAYRTMDNLTESGFTQLCKNFTEVNKCYANAGSDSGPMTAFLESIYQRPYECNMPIFKTVLRLCKLTYEDAMDTRNCYDNGMIQYSGSPEEAACRQKCCHDSSTFNASEPLLCGPGRDFLASVYCPNPVVDQTLKDNACQTSCAMEALTRYARNFCSDAALPVFMAYGKETMVKYLTLDKCFETCSGFD
uniref:Uncharacterized protein n=1 Tax=Panagrellus redivivus TaxID=6233 RepID=A0A7E4VSL3_PANRE